MDRRDWKGVIKRIRPSLRGRSTGDDSTGGNRKRVTPWVIWGTLTLAALLVAGVGLSATRNATFSKVGMSLPTQVRPLSGDGVVAGSSDLSLYTQMAGDMKPPAQPGNESTQQSQPWDRMIVRTANLQIKVKDVGASLDEVRGIAGARGGFVTQTDSHQDGDYTVATITLQVPAPEFDGVVSQLRKMGVKPVQETVSSSDVTEEYTDLQSQLRNLEATEQRILALMGKTTQIDDVLTLDRELRQIRGEIERVQGRLNFLGKRAEMSTITVSLLPETAPIAEVKPADGWDPAQVALQAWNASLDLLAGVGKIVISASVFLWWAVPVLLAIWLIMRPRRRTVSPSTPTGETS
ncbi:MAG TPA: DUF4349 domain-containing protein [Chloroflexia bacterium]|nr:DUF4349 domain-containing protein [Chloroflexia bacterium]